MAEGTAAEPADRTTRRGGDPAGKGAGDRLVWIDLEMTGLDAQHDAIVEIACIVTDASLACLDGGVDYVVHQDAATLARMGDYVRQMHTTSGLLAHVEASDLDVGAAQARVLEYVRGHVPPGVAPLCGNSIGMDRRFLARHMPELDGFLHYRNIDVSSLKELCRRWYPDVYRKRPAKSETHRALDDIRESIEELRYYRETMLRPLQQ